MPSRKQKAVLDPSFYTRSVSILLGLLISVLLLAIIGGIIKTFLDLRLLFVEPVESALRQVLVNVLTILAVVEVLRTALGYLTDGRVRVTFIIDTVLIVMLNEVISFWFRGGSPTNFAFLIIIILTLIFSRLMTVRFSPDTHE